MQMDSDEENVIDQKPGALLAPYWTRCLNARCHVSSEDGDKDGEAEEPKEEKIEKEKTQSGEDKMDAEMRALEKDEIEEGVSGPSRLTALAPQIFEFICCLSCGIE